MKFSDRISIGQTKDTSEGYLVATARVARTGVQMYLASELGDVATKAGFAPTDMVRVYRHPDQVFDKASLASITRLPVTLDHPSEEVTAANWAKYSVGDVGDAYAAEADWIVVNPMVKDSDAVIAARTTHKEISMGYRAGIVVARDGLDADFEQVGIRYNHLALVPKGRAGEMARIGDSWGASPVHDSQQGQQPTTASKGKKMSDSTSPIILGDKVVNVAIGDVAAVEKFKADTNKAMTDAATAHSAALADRDTQLGTLRAELKIAQDKAAASANVNLDALVAQRSTLLAQVKAIDDSIDPTGLTDAQLRAAAVASQLGDQAVKDAPEAEVNGMFRVLAANVNVGTRDAVADVIAKGVKTAHTDAATAMNDAKVKANADLNAWRNQ